MDRILFVTLAVSCAMASASPSARANGLGENRSWQFDNTRPAKLATLDLIERRKGGLLDADRVAPDTHTLSCSLTVNTIGNSNAPEIDAVVSSPTGVADSGISGTTSGNTAAVDTTNRDGAAPDTGQTNRDSDLSTALDGNRIINDIGSQTLDATNTQSNTVGQENSGSTLTAGANGNELCNDGRFVGEVYQTIPDD